MSPYRAALVALLTALVAGSSVLAAPSTAASAASTAASASAECHLAPFRERIDATLSSMQIERMTEITVQDVDGRPVDGVDGVDLGLTGAIDGCVALAGPVPDRFPDEHVSWLYDVPDISMPQEHFLTVDQTQPYPPVGPDSGNTSERFYAKGTFEAADGAGMTVILPTDRKQWNGKLFVFQHGGGSYTHLLDACYTGDCGGNPVGTLVRRLPGTAGPFTPGLGANLYLEEAIAKGYAAVWLRRDSVGGAGVSLVTLDDGTTVRTTHTAHVQSQLARAEFAQRFVAERMGREPRQTYYYGHSGGGIIGTLMNYSGANVAHDGSPIIDGLINDDQGNGLYLPIEIRNGVDTWPDAAQREAFVPQIDLYQPLYFPNSRFLAKRMSADLLRDKGLGDRHRAYEVAGASHFDAGQAGQPGSVDFIDRGPLVSALMDRLEDWVSKGVPPTPSKQAMPGSEPLQLPEVACPLGVFYAPGGGGRTRFAAFDGTTLEPIDPVTGDLIDMNGNGVRDRRETVTEAWRRLNLIAERQTVNLGTLRSCVARAANELSGQGLLPQRATSWYVERAAEYLAQTGARLR